MNLLIDNLKMRLSLKQRIEVLIFIGCGDMVRTQQEVCTMFNNKYPEQPITQSTVSKIEKKFREFGTVEDLPKSGRPKINDDTKLNVFLALEENPHNSVRQVSRDHDVPFTSVHKMLKNEKWHPFKIHLVQELSDDDPDRRMQFSETLMDKCNNDTLFATNIIFSDECTFTLNGEVNKQNCRYWAKENPKWMREHHTQYPQKVNVWAGIVRNKIIGPYFFDGTVNGRTYLHFLMNFLIPTLMNLFPSANNPGNIDETLWYQQDGAPPHYAAYIRNYLDEVFPNKWIGRRGHIEWPPRSPDLTPLDFFLWGHLKNVVYKSKPNDIQELKERIRQEINNISQETIAKVQQEFIARLGHCQAQEGLQFEHLL